MYLYYTIDKNFCQEVCKSINTAVAVFLFPLHEVFLFGLQEVSEIVKIVEKKYFCRRFYAVLP